MRFAKLVALSAVLLCAVTTSGYAATGAERHVAKGMKCEICHGPDKANPQLPTIDNCKTCHDIKALVEKTKNVKPTNPHVSPHYQDQLDCVNCHYMHEEPVNFCDRCHTFGFKVPFIKKRQIYRTPFDIYSL